MLVEINKIGRYTERSKNNIRKAIKDDERCIIFLDISILKFIYVITYFYNPTFINSENLSSIHFYQG